MYLEIVRYDTNATGFFFVVVLARLCSFLCCTLFLLHDTMHQKQDYINRTETESEFVQHNTIKKEKKKKSTTKNKNKNEKKN